MTHLIIYILNWTVDCIWSDFGPWSKCSKTCGFGTQKRKRFFAVAASGPDGKPCLGAPNENRSCNLKDCPRPTQTTTTTAPTTTTITTKKGTTTSPISNAITTTSFGIVKTTATLKTSTSITFLPTTRYTSTTTTNKKLIWGVNENGLTATTTLTPNIRANTKIILLNKNSSKPKPFEPTNSTLINIDDKIPRKTKEDFYLNLIIKYPHLCFYPSYAHLCPSPTTTATMSAPTILPTSTVTRKISVSSAETVPTIQTSVDTTSTTSQSTTFKSSTTTNTDLTSGMDENELTDTTTRIPIFNQNIEIIISEENSFEHKINNSINSTSTNTDDGFNESIKGGFESNIIDNLIDPSQAEKTKTLDQNDDGVDVVKPLQSPAFPNAATFTDSVPLHASANVSSDGTRKIFPDSKGISTSNTTLASTGTESSINDNLLEENLIHQDDDVPLTEANSNDVGFASSE